jgi:hypothetical protein
METKRANFEITLEQEASLLQLKQLLDAPSIKEAVLRSSRVMIFLANEMSRGKRLYLGESRESATRVALPDIEPSFSWKWLMQRPHPWRRQLWVKGRRLLASQVWADMQINGMTEEEAAINWDLPRGAIEEILAYCTQNTALIAMEANEEKRQLADAGVNLEIVH